MPPALVDARPFFAWEALWLAELGATDLRLALRLPQKPPKEVVERAAGEAIVAGDADLGVVDGALDPFSFATRARRLRGLRAELARAPDVGVPWTAEEKGLITRLLDEEDLRVVSEASLPEADSERVRALVATWGNPATPAQVDVRDQEVVRGLGAVLDDVAAGKLSGAREAELEDALDPLERLASPEAYPETTRLLIRLRVALGGRHEPVPPRAAPPLDLRLAVYLGVTDALDVLAARLQAAEVGLREAARSGLARLSEKEVDDARAAAADHVDEEALCAVPLGSSPLRALVPPPERALVCAPLRLLAAADRSPGTPVASLVAHDDVAVALWAARVATGATDVDAVRASCPLLSAVPSARQDRLVRAAFVQPVRVLAAGLAVALVEADGVEASPARARAWMSYGDAPFDVVAPQLPAK